MRPRIGHLFQLYSLQQFWRSNTFHVWNIGIIIYYWICFVSYSYICSPSGIIVHYQIFMIEIVLFSWLCVTVCIWTTWLCDHLAVTNCHFAFLSTYTYLYELIGWWLKTVNNFTYLKSASVGLPVFITGQIEAELSSIHYQEVSFDILEKLFFSDCIMQYLHMTLWTAVIFNIYRTVIGLCGH